LARTGEINRYALFGILLLLSWGLALFAIFAIVGNMYLDPTKDTVMLSNAAFGILALLATLSFGYARATEAADFRQKVVKVGEDFFLSAMIFAPASLIKYAMVKKVATTKQRVDTTLEVCSQKSRVLGSTGIASLRICWLIGGSLKSPCF
jgi:hypothetical protein